MKTRIISGVVMALILILVLFTGYYYPVIITASLAILCAIACYELLHNAVGIKNKLSNTVAMIYSAAAIFVLGGYGKTFPGNISTFTILSIVYVIFSAVMALYNHKDFELKEIFATASMPIILSYAFSCLEYSLNSSHAAYYLLLLLNFSSVCDMGAYFIGSAFGKHKLCPEISPKKTIEGAVGGVVSSLIVSLILVLAFGFKEKLIITLLLTVPFCVVGMVGDLFASAIKRSAKIKDYGKLIPGHGGILDRADSILLIAPILMLFIMAGVL